MAQMRMLAWDVSMRPEFENEASKQKARCGFYINGPAVLGSSPAKDQAHKNIMPM